MNNPPQHLYLAKVSMITPVGANALMTAAAVRARIRRGSASAHVNRDFNPMILASVPEDALPPLHDTLEPVDGLTARQLRLLRVLAPAIEDAMSGYTLKAPIPLFFAGPEALPGRPATLGNRFVEYLMKQTGANLDPASSRLFATGRAGGLQAIEMAFKYFASTGGVVALVGGAETVNDQHALRTHDNDDRVNATGVMNGFTPGEAAGFLLLATERGIAELRTAPLARIYRPGLADEPGHRYSEAPYRGDGLAQAFAAAIAQGDGASIGTIYSSQNGESFGAKEYGVACTRNQAAFQGDLEHEHPAECLGDVGAACGPILIGLAALDLQKGWREGPALVYCASEQHYRAAVCVTV